MLKRLKNKFFIAALAAGVYQVLLKYEVAPDLGTYQLFIDLVSYIAIGTGVYSTFEEPKGDE